MNAHNLHDKKILGIHFRGTSYKTSRGIFYQLLKYKNILRNLKKKVMTKYLGTEETRYLDFLKKYPDNYYT